MVYFILLIPFSQFNRCVNMNVSQICSMTIILYTKQCSEEKNVLRYAFSTLVCLVVPGPCILHKKF